MGCKRLSTRSREDKLYLRYAVHLELEIYAKTIDTGAYSASFRTDGLACHVRLLGDGQPITHSDGNQSFQTFLVQTMELVLNESGGKRLSSIIAPNKWDQLVQLLMDIANDCILQIRSVGRVPHVHPISVRISEESRFVLRKWNVERSEGGNTWVELSPMASLDSTIRAYVASQLVHRPKGWLDGLRWSAIRRELEESKEPDASAQCSVNAEEYVANDNLRLAVLESVTALELALAEYLRAYCIDVRHMTKKQAKDLLTPQLTLSMRLNGLLPLILGETELSFVVLNQVNRVVGWRNDIVHRKGNIHPGVSNEEVRQGVQAVIKLARRLRKSTRSKPLAAVSAPKKGH
jgi:hypothetical protein